MACRDMTVTGYAVGGVREAGGMVEFTIRIPARDGTRDDLKVQCWGGLADNVAATICGRRTPVD